MHNKYQCNWMPNICTYIMCDWFDYNCFNRSQLTAEYLYVCTGSFECNAYSCIIWCVAYSTGIGWYWRHKIFTISRIYCCESKLAHAFVVKYSNRPKKPFCNRIMRVLLHRNPLIVHTIEQIINWSSVIFAHCLTAECDFIK